MAASTAPAAKAAIETALTASAALTGVAVEWGRPAKPPTTKERIYIVGVDQVSREWAGLGQQRLREEYRVELLVENVEAGQDKKACEQRWWAIVNAIEIAIRADIDLGGAVQDARPQVRQQRLGVTDDDSLISTGLVDVICRSPSI